MKIKQIAKVKSGQDGAIFKNFFFRFNHLGECFVYDLDVLGEESSEEAEVFAEFKLDMSDKVAPHSNCVMFGTEYYCKDDEFPLLYSNIYNNCAKEENQLKGVCMVYRISREDNKFSSKLVQIIEIGFTEDEKLWCSEGGNDIRPYGNFLIDAENKKYYAFTMIDKIRTTRYFVFDLPKMTDGVKDNEFSCNKVTLKSEDIKESFDCEYHRFIQGGCFYDGKIYSLEGFEPGDLQPVMRIIDTNSKKQTEKIDLVANGLKTEPEFIDFKDGICYYADNPGNLYIIDFC